ncbi:MAG: GntR family transcriptional regulator [Verrucomicrobium sp.]|nr:GntR family transcriptional regulator [Verrucomicrobium sp.]
MTDSLSTKAYHHIQRKLLSGEWGSGDVLSELSVAQEMGISRTPVREAFRNLEQEGVLEQVPRFGTRVRSLDRKDMVELFELREALEPYAVAQAAGRLNVEDRETLRALCAEFKLTASDLRQKGKSKPDAGMMKRLMSADMAFHQLLIRASGNRRMMKIVAESRVLAQIFTTSRQEHDIKVIEQTYQHHISILEAVESGRGDTAREMMAEHIRASMNEALAHYDRQHAAADTRSISLGLPEEMLTELHRIEKHGKAIASRKRVKAS